MVSGKRPTPQYPVRKKGSGDASHLQRPSLRTQSGLPTTFGDSHASETNGHLGSAYGRLNGLTRSALVQQPAHPDLKKTFLSTERHWSSTFVEDLSLHGLASKHSRSGRTATVSAKSMARRLRSLRSDE